MLPIVNMFNLLVYLYNIFFSHSLSSDLDSGNTPAHGAASGHMSALACLINHGANISLTNHQGDTPEALSKKQGHTTGYRMAGLLVY